MPTTAGCCFRVHHGIKQTDYVDWKFRGVERYVRSAPRVSGNGYYFRTISHPEFSTLRELFYPAGKKVVPFELLGAQLDAFGLAVWIMDDGALDGMQLRINTQSFSLGENVGMIGFLRAKFGLEAHLNVDKSQHRLRFQAVTMQRLVSIVRPHFIPSMLYKLPL